MKGFVLAPVEPTEEMTDAAQEEISERQKCGCGIFLSDIWGVALSAIPALTDAEVDDLCWAMWGEDTDGWWYSELCRAIDGNPESPSSKYCERFRDRDRARMRSFLARIGQKPPAGEKA